MAHSSQTVGENEFYINCTVCDWVGIAQGPYCPSCGHNNYPTDNQPTVGSNETPNKEDVQKQ